MEGSFVCLVVEDPVSSERKSSRAELGSDDDENGESDVGSSLSVATTP